MNALSWWWPTPERLNEVLLGDADGHSPAVALAVHQRMHIRRRHHDEHIDTDRAETVDEGTILRQLQEPVGDGCQVVLIEGKSGTGKSHIVRWLEIQLDRLQDRASRVVLYVSKGSRLRDIVKDLCDRPELAGAEHADLRHQLSRAQEPVEPEVAASRLVMELALVCKQRSRDATAKAEKGQGLTELERLQKSWGHPTRLPYILVHPDLTPLLVDAGGPVRRLVEHLHAKADRLVPRTQPEFVEADLAFEPPEGLDDKARRAVSPLQDHDARCEAVRVLNDALDDAKRISLGLDPGVVREVFASIRKALRDEKELVLLVEDFADLSGLQKEVLQAAIQTGSPGGTKTYCTLRTVLAFTDGFFHELTVFSRAQYVYYVPNQLDEDEVVEKSIRLVGSYLQAARCGAAALEKAMLTAHGTERWLPTPPEVGDEESALLDAFGRSEDIPLFPFTRRVVERLVRDTYAGKAALLFVPRDIIRDVMPRVLSHRGAFARGVFPTEAFRPSREAQLTDEQSRWLKKVNPTGAMRQRLESFVLYWGLNAGAAHVFGLPQPDRTDSPTTPSVVGGTGKRGRSPEVGTSGRRDEKKGGGGSSAPPPSSVADLFADERMLFKDWRAGTDIASNHDRRAIRNAIDACLRPALGWVWRPRIDKPAAVAARWSGWQEWIDVAGLRLAADARVPLTLVSPEEREDKLRNEALAKELVAVYGLSPSNPSSPKTWDVEGIEAHLAAHLSFIERHRPAVERHLLGIWYSRKWDALPFLVNALAVTGAVLGVQNCGSSVPEEFIDALFADPPEAEHDSAWSQEVSRPLRALRSSLRELVEREIGAYQGTGEAVHGLNTARLMQFVPAPRSEPAALPAVPSFPTGANNDPDIKTVLATTAIVDQVDTASITELDARRALAARVRAYLGEGLEKDPLVTALGALLQELKQLDALTEERATEMKAVLTALKKAAVVDPLESTDRLVASDASLWQRLVSLGRNEPEAARLANTERVLAKVDGFLQEHERHLPESTNIDPLDEALAAHEAQLADARVLLGDLAPTNAKEGAT